MAVSAVKKETGKLAADAGTPAPDPKKRGFKWKLPLIALIVISAVSGGAYWYSIQHHDEAGKEVKTEPVKPPQFLPLEPFTVNLLLEDNPQFLQVGLTLKVPDNAAVDALKLHMPEVRDRILLLLSSQKASILLTLDGKRKLAADIVASINAIITPTAAPSEATPRAVAQSPVKSDAKTSEPDTKQAAETDTKADDDSKPADEADAKPAAETGDAPAAAVAPAPRVLSVLFTSFIVQ